MPLKVPCALQSGQERAEAEEGLFIETRKPLDRHLELSWSPLMATCAQVGTSSPPALLSTAVALALLDPCVYMQPG